MKGASFILALYIIALVLYPCNDTNSIVDEPGDGISAVNITHSHAVHELDICTPFCICSCCSAHYKVTQVNPMEKEFFNHNTPLISFYIERPVLDISRTIWQPPKI